MLDFCLVGAQAALRDFSNYACGALPHRLARFTLLL